METKSSSEKRFALLIDADNVSAKYIKPILDELSKYGAVTYKRIYGDWTLTLHNKWKDALLDNSITPIQQFGYTQGKNATDSAMIIDAMDILYTKSVEGFCIVSSDSDFTRLASRIRESGLTVIGMGEKKTPTAFRKACDIFTTLELLLNEAKGKGKGESSAPTLTKAEVERAVVDIITDNQNNGKSTGLGEVGSRLLKRYPDFDVRSFGTNLLSKLLSEFESVKINKDRSNVSVELADVDVHDASAAPAVESEPASSEASEPEPKAEGDGEETADDSKSRRRRSRRRTRSKKQKDAETGTGEEQVVEETAGDGAASAEAAAEEPAPAQAATEAPVTEEPEAPKAEKAAAKAKPKSKSKSQAKAKNEAGEKPEEKPAAKPKKEAKAKASSQAAPKAKEKAAAKTKDTAEDMPASKAPARRGRPKKSEAIEAKTPDEFLQKLIAQAGEDGVSVAELSRRVRVRFSGFKVRDKGYPHLAAYLGDVEGVRVFKKGRESWAASE